jgi:sodium/hydrogen antiporter
VTELIVFGVVVVAYGLVSRRLEGTPVTAPMVFVAAGIAASAAGTFGIGVEQSRVLVPETPKHVAELALVLLLFTGAARIDVRALRSTSNLPLRLLAIGLPLSILLGGLIALGLFSGTLDLWEAFLVGAILAPTDAALGAVIVSSQKLSLRLRQAIDVEAGLNDGLAVPFFTVFAALAASEALGDAPFLTVALEKLGYGILMGLGFGVAGGWLVRVFSARGWMTGAFRQLAVVSLALLAWWCAEEVGGSGLIAAFVAGLAFGVAAREIAGESVEFADDVGQLLSLLVFFALGLIALDAFELATWQMAAFAVLALTVIRMLPVALALLGTGLSRSTVAYVGWFGPRGLASILLALILVIEDPDLPGNGTIFTVVVLTVLLSVFLHGATAAPLTDRLARRSLSSRADD